MPKYTRTTFKVVVLSSDADSTQPVSTLSLDQVAYEIYEGCCSGSTECVEEVELTEESMRQALLAMGSDPAFLIQE